MVERWFMVNRHYDDAVREDQEWSTPLVAGDSTRSAREIVICAGICIGAMIFGGIIISAVALFRIFW